MKAKFFAIAALAFVGGITDTASATTIDFSSLAAPGTLTEFIGPVEVGGFWLQPGPTSQGISAIISATYAYPATQHPSPGDMWAVPLNGYGGGTFSKADGGAFTLNQIDLNSLYDVTGPLSWELQGWFADGSATTLLNGNLQPDTFSTVTPNWSNLISVEFTAYGGGWMGVNNIDVTTAPVPGPVVGAGLPGLIAACGALFGWWRRKRKAEA